jgi:tight adherence protein B
VSGQGWWVVAFLVGGAIVVVWPVSLARRRWTRREPVTLAWRPLVASARAEAVRRPRRALVVVAVLVGLGGWVAAGPVAAGALGTYAALAARGVLRRWAGRERAAARARTLDEVGALAADLRAGLPAAVPAPTAVGSTAAPVGSAGAVDLAGPVDPVSSPASAGSPEVVRLRELVAAAWRLAERTGAPVADLVDRIEADARAADRARASTAAQAAGARATALLLAGLPAGGIALGYAIGADPLQVLLHTPLGAACVAGALLLQLGGLAWADRLAGSGSPR